MGSRGRGFQILRLLPAQVSQGLQRGAGGDAASLPLSRQQLLSCLFHMKEEFSYFQKA